MANQNAAHKQLTGEMAGKTIVGLPLLAVSKKPMNKRILYATTNPSKIAHMRNLLASLPVEILNLVDVGIKTQAPEDGDTPAENARQKVEFAFPKCEIPTVAVDSGLYIESFPKEKQPGLYVRRIFGKDYSASDDEMLSYYQQELNKVGGQSKGTWVTAIAFRINVSQIYCETFVSDTFFTSKISDLPRKLYPSKMRVERPKKEQLSDEAKKT